MQYYIPTQDVLGALSDVFSKCNYQFDRSKHSESLEKLASTFQSRMDTNKFKSNLDKYIEKVKQQIQTQNGNDGSLSLSNQYNDILKQNDQQTTGNINQIKSRIVPITLDQQIQTNTICNQEASVVNNACQISVEQVEVLTQTQYNMIDASTNTDINEDNRKRTEQNQLQLFSQEVSIQIQEHQIKLKSQDFQCQIDQLQEDSQNMVLNQRFENNSDQQQQSYHSSDLIDNLQIIHDQINEECIKCQCGKNILFNKKKLIDAECQYDISLDTQQSIIMNNLDMEMEQRFKHIRIRSRCMSQTNQTNQKIQINDEDQITFLENELLLKSELLETKNQVILKLHSQIEDLHKLINDQKDSARIRKHSDSEFSNKSDNWKIEELQQQIETNADVQDQITKQMLQYSEETRNLEQQISYLRDQNQDLKDELYKLTIQITQLKEQQAEMEDNKTKEIDIINEDYQDKLSKQNMIIDDLQQQINSISASPMGLPQISMPQTMKYINQQQFQTVGSDSQQSKGSNCKTKEEKQQLMRNIKRMTTMTAGLMSNKQDYTTLGVLGKIDQYKSQQKLESFNKLN